MRIDLSVGVMATFVVVFGLAALAPGAALCQPVEGEPVDFDSEMGGVPWEGGEGEMESEDGTESDPGGGYDIDSGSDGAAPYTTSDSLPDTPTDSPFGSPGGKPDVGGEEIPGVKPPPPEARRQPRKRSRASLGAWRGARPPRFSQRPLTAPRGHGQAFGGLDLGWVDNGSDDHAALFMSLGGHYAVDNGLEIGFAQHSDPFADFGGPEGVRCSNGECYHTATIWGDTDINVVQATAGGPSGLNLWEDEGTVEFMYWLGPVWVRYKISDKLVFKGEMIVPVDEFSLRFVSLRGGVEFKNPLDRETSVVGHAMASTTLDLSYLNLPLRVGLQRDFSDEVFGQVDIGMNFQTFRFTGLFAEDSANLYGGSYDFYDGPEDNDFDFDVGLLTFPFRLLFGYTIEQQVDVTVAMTIVSLKEDVMDRILLQLAGIYHF